MNRTYEIPLPRAALRVTAVALSAITLSLFVVLPAQIEGATFGSNAPIAEAVAAVAVANAIDARPAAAMTNARETGAAQCPIGSPESHAGASHAPQASRTPRVAS